MNHSKNIININDNDQLQINDIVEENKIINKKKD